MKMKPSLIKVIQEAYRHTYILNFYNIVYLFKDLRMSSTLDIQKYHLRQVNALFYMNLNLLKFQFFKIKNFFINLYNIFV